MEFKLRDSTLHLSLHLCNEKLCQGLANLTFMAIYASRTLANAPSMASGLPDPLW